MRKSSYDKQFLLAMEPAATGPPMHTTTDLDGSLENGIESSKLPVVFTGVATIYREQNRPKREVDIADRLSYVKGALRSIDDDICLKLNVERSL